MRRSLSSIAALVLAVTLAACGGDVATAPEAPAGPPQLRITVDRMAPDSTSADFTVDRQGGVFQIGPHAVYFPARSICDPATSGYGTDMWDAPCAPMQGSIQIHAEVRKIDGREWVDFSPELRFVPSKNPDKWVYIWMRSSALIAAGNAAESYNILWSPAFGVAGIDESLTDPTLKTMELPGYGIVYRRIKHFSGYQVALGYIDQTVTSTDGTLLGGM